MKEWGLLKTQADYLFFHEITKMLFTQKIERFGKQFFEDYAKIIEMKTPQSVRNYINDLKDSKRKILVADTYFSILQGGKAKADFEKKYYVQ